MVGNKGRARALTLECKVGKHARGPVDINPWGTGQMNALKGEVVVAFTDDAAFAGDVPFNVAQDESWSEVVQGDNGPVSGEMGRIDAANGPRNTGEFQTGFAALIKRQGVEVQRDLLRPNRLFLTVSERHVGEGDEATGGVKVGASASVLQVAVAQHQFSTASRLNDQ